FGCDGVVLATPTGSTAYAFSSGGPVVWPEVEALLIVPLSAHALFARPLVVAPTSVPAVELLADARGGAVRGRRAPACGSPPAAGGGAVVGCAGRRSIDLPPGGRVEVRRSATKV